VVEVPTRVKGSQFWRPKLEKSKEYEVYEKIVFISLCLVSFFHIESYLHRTMKRGSMKCSRGRETTSVTRSPTSIQGTDWRKCKIQSDV
jgi:hypothetical protein